MKDADGRQFVREGVELMRKQASAWQDYRFMNPLDKKIEPKQMYIERLDNIVIGCSTTSDSSAACAPRSGKEAQGGNP